MTTVSINIQDINDAMKVASILVANGYKITTKQNVDDSIADYKAKGKYSYTLTWEIM